MKQARLCLAGAAAAAPVMQTLSQGQSDRGVSERCFGKPDMTEWTFIWQQQQKKNPPLSTAVHPPAGFIQRLNWFGWRLHWHLLASIVALKERLEQSRQDVERLQRKR